MVRRQLLAELVPTPSTMYGCYRAPPAPTPKPTAAPTPKPTAAPEPAAAPAAEPAPEPATQTPVSAVTAEQLAALTGTYSDPHHPGCLRSITMEGDSSHFGLGRDAARRVGGDGRSGR